MPIDLSAARAFIAVAKAGGFRGAAKETGISASSLSGLVKRLEDQLGLRLLHRTTRNVAMTEAGSHLMTRLEPAIREVDAAFDDINGYRKTPHGTLRLNVPVNVARLVLPRLLPGFLAAFPQIRVEVTAEHELVDILAAGYDAGIRYDERLTKNMVAVPIGPAIQRFATAAAPAYLARHGRPEHPNDLVQHACLTGRVGHGAPDLWEFERDGQVIRVEPIGQLAVDVNAVDLAISSAVDGCGLVHVFEEWVRPALENGTLVPVLEPWWQNFSGPMLYYHGKERVPAPLDAFIHYVEGHRW